MILFLSQSSTEALIEAATSTPLHVQGKLTRQGDSVEFVAEDLDEKIRMSSPHSKRGKGIFTPCESSHESDKDSEKLRVKVCSQLPDFSPFYLNGPFLYNIV